MMLALLGGEPQVAEAPPHNDLCKFTAEDREAILQYIDSPAATISYFGREGLLREFEDELCHYHGTKYCILTNSGTNAIHSAYFGIGLRPGDEVIVPTYTFLATVTPLIPLGAIPVLADCESDTGNICPVDIERKITDRTKAIMVTHQWGHPVEMDAIRSIARSNSLRILEDTSLAVGGSYNGRRLGTLGDVAAFSLGSTKLLSGGQGGALITNDSEIAERANLIGHFLVRSSDQVQSSYYRQFLNTGYGHNYRMHVLAVAMARNRFLRMNELIEKRKRRFGILTDALNSVAPVEPPITRDGMDRGSWVGYTATYLHEQAKDVTIDTFVSALNAEGVECFARGYPYHPLLHRTRFFQSVDDGYYFGTAYAKRKRTYSDGDFPIAEQHVASQIAFPIFLDEPIGLVKSYGEAIRKVGGKLDELLVWQSKNPRS